MDKEIIAKKILVLKPLLKINGEFEFKIDNISLFTTIEVSQ